VLTHHICLAFHAHPKGCAFLFVLSGNKRKEFIQICNACLQRNGSETGKAVFCIISAAPKNYRIAESCAFCSQCDMVTEYSDKVRYNKIIQE